jgi:hypothetical protein
MPEPEEAVQHPPGIQSEGRPSNAAVINSVPTNDPHHKIRHREVISTALILPSGANVNRNCLHFNDLSEELSP